jgi:ketosteroid isomerase-like protein
MRPMLSLVLVLCLANLTNAQSSPDAAELTKLLQEFLVGASNDDRAMHDRFWAEDLIYTGSSGRRIGKSDIVRDQRPATPRPSPQTVYSAEDIRIQQYGTTAIVAFRLVAKTNREGGTETSSYFNTGTFLKRSGKWQVVAWQATKIPRSEEDAKREAGAVEAAFQHALLAADDKKLESLLDESFVWTHDGGEQVSGRQLLDQLKSGQLKYSVIETSNVNISISGDTAIVRGSTQRQRSAIPGASAGDANSFKAYYTLTLVNKGAGWKVVAIHSSRP